MHTCVGLGLTAVLLVLPDRLHAQVDKIYGGPAELPRDLATDGGR